MPRRESGIYKRKDGRWEARYLAPCSNSDKKRLVSVYAKTYSEAKNKRAAALQNQLTQCSFNVQDKKLLNDLLREWLSFKEAQLKASSYQKYERTIRSHIQNTIGLLPIKDITQPILQKYAQELLLKGNVKSGKGLAPKSVNAVLTLIGSALTWSQCSAQFRKIPFIKENRPKPHTLTPQEQILLEEYLEKHPSVYGDGVLLSLSTGMRLGELCALQKKDINNGVIYVHQTMQRLKSPDGRWRIVVTSPKTLNSVRQIPIPTKLKPILDAYSVGEGFVLTQNNGRCVEPRLLQKWFGVILRCAGIQQMNFHSLRHTFATRLIEDGCDAKTVSELLGHSNVQTTLNKYTHPSFETKKRAIDRTF